MHARVPYGAHEHVHAHVQCRARAPRILPPVSPTFAHPTRAQVYVDQSSSKGRRRSRTPMALMSVPNRISDLGACALLSCAKHSARPNGLTSIDLFGNPLTQKTLLKLVDGAWRECCCRTRPFSSIIDTHSSSVCAYLSRFSFRPHTYSPSPPMLSFLTFPPYSRAVLIAGAFLTHVTLSFRASQRLAPEVERESYALVADAASQNAVIERIDLGDVVLSRTSYRATSSAS